MKKILLILCFMLLVPTFAQAATHQYPEHFFQITLPDSWQIKSEQEVDFETNEVLYAEENDTSILSIDVFDNPDYSKEETYDVFSKLEKQEMLDSAVFETRKLYPNIVFHENSFEHVNNIPAILITATYTDKNGVKKNLSTFDVLKNSKVYIVYLVTEKPMAEHIMLFKQIINSLKTI